MGKSSRDIPLDLIRDAARDPGVRRAAAATAAAVGAGAAAAKITRDRRDGRGRVRDREFALHPGEGITPGLTRIARGQIDDVVEQLTPQDGALSEDAVHEARKSLKRLRAMARLLRGELGPDRYERENAALRDAGQRLSGARDAEVLLDTLQDVIAADLGGEAGPGVAALRAELLAERQSAEQGVLSDPEIAAGATRDVRAVRRRVAHWVHPDADFEAVAPGLGRIYRQGRQRYRGARGDPRPENLHEWRKRVKDLRHAAEILVPADPKRMRKLARRADRLGETLGSEHDLWLLDERVRARGELFDQLAERDALLRAIRRRRRRLTRSAFAQAQKLYADKPTAFVKRIARDWRAAR